MWLVPRFLFYPSLLWNVVREGPSRRWYDRIDDRVILGALPLRKHVAELVSEENVRTVISLNERYELRFFAATSEEWGDVGVEQVIFETQEYFSSPSQSNIYEALRLIKECGDRGSTAYVHCKAGRGRSAVLIACYLVAEKGMSPDEALEFMVSKRPQVKMMPQQFEAVRDFQRNLLSNNQY
ncbi:phosphatidylglycerophosphatase and protein-tyrosine phosphatase 1-like [Oscarella lobularis]|uniref:phosphatidylglycerophosphatase and protein-tyrosine phosphatase 1-like n=1 Tax=Oscarella lobularis TaxID=121494 RepID=UPI0033132AF0